MVVLVVWDEYVFYGDFEVMVVCFDVEILVREFVFLIVLFLLKDCEILLFYVWGDFIYEEIVIVLGVLVGIVCLCMNCVRMRLNFMYGCSC